MSLMILTTLATSLLLVNAVAPARHPRSAVSQLDAIPAGPPEAPLALVFMSPRCRDCAELLEFLHDEGALVRSFPAPARERGAVIKIGRDVVLGFDPRRLRASLHRQR